MNSSFHIIVFSFYALLVAMMIIKNKIVFSGRYEVVRFLAFTLLFSLFIFLISEIIFYVFIAWYMQMPFLSYMAMGLYAFGMISFTFLGIVDRPTQLQRKIFWRFPIFGMLVGFFLKDSTEYLVIVSLILSLILLFRDQRHPIQFKKLLQIFILVIVSEILLKWNFLNLFDVLMGLFIIIHFKYVNDFLVKNLIREKLS